jgi:hypothetical protein
MEDHVMTATLHRQPVRRLAERAPGPDSLRSEATPLTAAAAPLLAALERAAAFASADEISLPELNWLRLAYDGEATLTALATDRYVAARITLAVTPDASTAARPWATLLRRRDALLIAHAYRTGRSRATDEHLSLRLAGSDQGGYVLHVAPAAEPPSADLAPLRPADPRVVVLSIQCPRGQGVDLEAMFARHSGTDSPSTGTQVSVAPERLAHVARHAPKRQPMRLRMPSDRKSPIRIDSGPDFTALLMPMR